MESRSFRACASNGVSDGDMDRGFDQRLRVRQTASATRAWTKGEAGPRAAQRGACGACGRGWRPGAGRRRQSGGRGACRRLGRRRAARTEAGGTERGCRAWHRPRGRRGRRRGAAPVQRPAPCHHRGRTRSHRISDSTRCSRRDGSRGHRAGRHQCALPPSPRRHHAAIRLRLTGQVPARGGEPWRQLRRASLRVARAGPGRAWRPRAVAACGVTRLELIAVEGLPEVSPGDDLGALISSKSDLKAGDILVVAQKVVSKSEGRMISLQTVTAGEEAVRIASNLIADPDPRMVQVVLDESVRVLRSHRVLITETSHGFVCANSGVECSNIRGDDVLTLLPKDPDGSADRLRRRLHELAGVDVGVIISDTFGRPWRLGIVNVALGIAGLPALVDLRGTVDDTGKPLHATVLAVADDIAAAAGLVMGKTERTPAVIVRGLQIEGGGRGTDLVRPAAEDLFR